MRVDGLLRDVLKGRILEKNGTGQSSKGMINDLKEAINTLKEATNDSRERGAHAKMKRMAVDREKWRDWVPGTCSRAENS